MTYRLLNEGEKILPTDEYWSVREFWRKMSDNVDRAVTKEDNPIRRAIEQPQIVESREVCDCCKRIASDIECNSCNSYDGYPYFLGIKMAEVNG